MKVEIETKLNDGLAEAPAFEIAGSKDQIVFAIEDELDEVSTGGTILIKIK